MILHFFQLRIRKKVVKLCDWNKNYISLLRCHHSILPFRDFLVSMSHLHDGLKMLEQLIMTKDFPWLKLSYLVKTFFLGIDNLPLPPIATGIRIIMLNFYRSFHTNFTSFNNIKSSGLWTLIINYIIGVKPLLLDQIIKLKYPVITKLI